MRINLLLLLLALGCGWGCQSGPAADDTDFETFYQRFLTDSVYQIEHITFPLEGIPSNAGQEVDPTGYRYSKAEWRMHRPFDPAETGFRSTFTTLGDDLVIEQIRHESGDYGMMRRFARLEDGWHLIYYAGLNPLEE